MVHNLGVPMQFWNIRIKSIFHRDRLIKCYFWARIKQIPLILLICQALDYVIKFKFDDQDKNPSLALATINVYKIYKCLYKFELGDTNVWMLDSINVWMLDRRLIIGVICRCVKFEKQTFLRHVRAMSDNRVA